MVRWRSLEVWSLEVWSDSFLLSHDIFGMAVKFGLDQWASITLHRDMWQYLQTFWLTY